MPRSAKNTAKLLFPRWFDLPPQADIGRKNPAGNRFSPKKRQNLQKQFAAPQKPICSIARKQIAAHSQKN